MSSSNQVYAAAAAKKRKNAFLHSTVLSPGDCGTRQVQSFCDRLGFATTLQRMATPGVRVHSAAVDPGAGVCEPGWE